MNETPRVLIANGDPEMLHTLSRLLERAAYRVIRANSGQEALRLAEETEPDLVLLDVVLPDVDSVEVCRRIKADPALVNCLVVLVSDPKTASENQAEWLEAGADGHIVQLTPDRALLAQIETLLHAKWTEKALQKRTRELDERVKELDCLYSISKLVEQPGISVPEVLQGTVELIPPAWQYPEITCARITFEGRTFQTAGFKETQWMQASQIVAYGKPAGSVEVCYLEERPASDEGPFLKEERDLLDAIAGRLGTVTQRVRSRKALDREHKLLNRILKTSPVGITVVNREGEIVSANHRAEKVLGLTEDEITQRIYNDPTWRITDRDGNPFPDEQLPFQQVMNTKQPVYDVRHAIVWPDGQRKLLSINGAPVLDESGHVECAVFAITDVTEDVRKTERLERFNRVLHAIRDVDQLIVREKDVDRLIEGICERLVGTRGYHSAWVALLDKEGELLTAAEAGLGESFPSVVERLKRGEMRVCGIPALSQPGIWISDEPLDCPLSTLYKDKKLMAIRLEHAGRVYGLVTVSLPDDTVADETERDLFEKMAGDVAFALHSVELEERREQAVGALQESEKRYRDFFKTSKDCVFFTSKDGRWIDMNDAAVDLFGCESQEELRRVRIPDLYADPADRKVHLREIERQGFTKEHPINLRRKDGTVINTLITSVAVRDESGDVIGFQGTIRDITERIRAEKELRLFKTLVESSQEAVAISDADGHLVYVNPAHEKLFGRSLEEAQQLNYRDYYPPQSVEILDREAAPALAQGESWEGELDAFDASGRRFPLWERAGSILDDEGNMLYGFGFMHDITERKQAEEALRESEERYRTLFESSPTSITLVGLDGTVLDCNPATVALAGLPRERIVGRPFTALSPLSKETLSQYEESFAQIINGEGVDYLRLEITSGGGKTRWLEAFPTLIEEDGKARAIQVIARDVTERVRAEEALQESEARFRMLTESTLAGVYIFQEGKFRYVNAALGRIFGYTPDDIVGKLGPLDLTHPDDHPKVAERIRRRLERETESAHYAFRGLRKDGTIIHCEVLGRRVEYQEQPAIIGTLLDVTDREEMEEQLRQQERLAAVGQLAGGIAHDFNNFLAAIILYAQIPLSKHDDLPPDVVNALETILGESNRAADLVDQILDFSRSSMLETEPMDLIPFARDVIRILRRTIPESIRLHLEVEPRTCTIEADPTRIQQMLINLAVNARDAMPNGGDLRIALNHVEVGSDERPPVMGMPPGQWALLTIADTGTGMAEEVQAHLFEPFFTTKEPGRGTGLGLSQVYGIVKQHEGYIDFETAPGEGTQFRVYLPCCEVTTEETEQETPSDPPLGKGKTILLVEDSEKLRDAVRRSLESLDYRVLTAVNGREALEVTRSQEVDLVVTDVVMPGMGGEQLLQRLSEEDPGLKTVAITGYVMETDLQVLEEAGFVGILRKPFDIERLAKTIRRALDAD